MHVKENYHSLVPQDVVSVVCVEVLNQVALIMPETFTNEKKRVQDLKVIGSVYLQRVVVHVAR